MQENLMYEAFLRRDGSFEGIFFVGVKTTGIFCRPSCRARKPKRRNVEFFSSTKEALLRGYRPCKICHPMLPKGEAPEWVKTVLDEASRRGDFRVGDSDIRQLGLDPNRLRRWFKRNHKMTFQAYLRSVRLGHAFGRLSGGKKVIETAFDHGYESLSGFSEAFKKAIGISPSASPSRNIMHVNQILTPLGPMLATSVKEGVCLLEFIDRTALESELKDLRERFKAPLVVSLNPHLKELRTQLAEYFSGKRKSFSIPLATPGSVFQNRVWRALLEIPYGETRSYKEQSVAIGNPKALRAVARANGQNRVAILIPCHRVIGSNGELVGYSGGVWRKKHLLALENGAKNAFNVRIM